MRGVPTPKCTHVFARTSRYIISYAGTRCVYLNAFKYIHGFPEQACTNLCRTFPCMHMNAP